MKRITWGLGWMSACVGGVALLAVPAKAQFVSIPVTNGSFALTNTGAGNQYVNPGAPLTLLSPAGTINVTAVANQPIYQGAFNITTNTPIGVYLTGISGSAALNDGITATFNGTAAAKLETLGTVTGAANYFAGAAIPNGATVAFTVVSGSFDIPQAALSAYPTPQLEIPVTGGSFTLTAPTGAGFETMTINGILTASGTANLTLSFPLLTDPANTAFPYVIGGAARPVAIGGIINGTIALNDGRSLSVNERLVRLEGTAQVTSAAPNNTYQFPAVYGAPISLTGTFTGGTISVPVPTVVLAAPPNVAPDRPDAGVNIPNSAPNVSLETPAVQLGLSQIGAIDFSQFPNRGGEIITLPELTPGSQPSESTGEKFDELAASPLAYSRIHPCVSAMSSLGFRCR